METETQLPAVDPKKAVHWRILRTWPALMLVGLMVIIRLSPNLFEEKPLILVIASVVRHMGCCVFILIWWLTASRATGREKLVGFFGVIITFIIATGLIDPSMRGSGFMFPMGPMGIAGFAIGATLFRRNLSFRRTWLALLLAFLGFGASAFVRNSGMSGDYALKLHWRWTASPEEIMLADKSATDNATPTAANEIASIEAAVAHPEWPGFRGADRTATHRGPAISSNWDTNPPELLWKIPVGPGWSSFAVAGDYLFTQEQRGPMETVVCYHADTGREIWASGVESRFFDPLGGPGPRATPTLAEGGLFAQSTEGWLMRLAPATGEIVWKQDLRQVADRKPPQWGFSSSPLVTGSVVIVHAGGAGDKGTLAFDIKSGDLRWSAASGDHSYSSPQLTTILGEETVLMLTNRGIELLDPESGVSRLDYDWLANSYRSIQPAVIGDESILLPTGMNIGTRRIRISKEGEKFAGEEMWTSRHLKPDFNDCVIYEGHAYGFDASIFTCIDLETGERSWKGGRYGKGQVLLLETSGLLLIAAEQGEIVLLRATPEAHTELTRFQAIEGKTWNHPVVIGERLYVRNAQEAACYLLPMTTP